MFVVTKPHQPNALMFWIVFPSKVAARTAADAVGLTKSEYHVMAVEVARELPV